MSWDCADLLTTNPLPGGRSSRMVGTITRSAQSLLCRRRHNSDKAGKYRFRLKAGNGEIIAAGEAYDTKAAALNGVESVKRNAADATVDDQT